MLAEGHLRVSDNSCSRNNFGFLSRELTYKRQRQRQREKERRGERESIKERE